jgi:hypothetical protein
MASSFTNDQGYIPLGKIDAPNEIWLGIGVEKTSAKEYSVPRCAHL